MKKVLMILFSLAFGFLALLAIKNYLSYGIMAAFPYLFVSFIFLCLAGSLNKGMVQK